MHLASSVISFYCVRLAGVDFLNIPIFSSAIWLCLKRKTERFGFSISDHDIFIILESAIVPCFSVTGSVCA